MTPPASRPAPRAVVEPLLAWFARHGRHALPWRTEVTPYRVVVAETMLQQTQVDRVVPLFLAFVERWPSFDGLAAASPADVVRAWKGLGYNSRAVRLHALARAVASDGGTLPVESAALARLPGVGPYTRAAVQAFAFDLPVLAIDVNLRRVLHRVGYGMEWPPAATPGELDRFGDELAAAAGAGFALNSALMDLGATVCTARAPKCLLCPLRTACAAAPIDVRELAERRLAHAPTRGPQARLAFEETTRYLRGRIVDRLRDCADGAWLDLAEVMRAAAALRPPRGADDVAVAIAALVTAGIVERDPSRDLVRLRHT